MLIDKEIEKKFLPFAVQSTMATLQRTAVMNLITNDKGDRYQANATGMETEEPVPSAIDNAISCNKVITAAKLNSSAHLTTVRKASTKH